MHITVRSQAGPVGSSYNEPPNSHAEMTRWVAGYKLDNNDLITFLKKTNWIKPDEEIDNDHIHRVFSSWALHEVWKTLKEGGFVPWPQCE